MLTKENKSTLYVYENDRDWWIQKARELEWSEAVTYSGAASHEYVVVGRTPNWTVDDAVRAAHVIRVFGRPLRFFQEVNCYFEDEEIGYKYWSMSGPYVEANEDLVNRAPIGVDVGKQNLPDTRSGIPSLFDYGAPAYDLGFKNESLWRQVFTQIKDRFGTNPPDTLDVGCGTGHLLDQGLVSQFKYTGVDPSQGMLNQLVMKYPKSLVIANTLQGAVNSGQLFGTFDLVTALNVSHHLQRDEVMMLSSFVAPGGLLLIGPSEDGKLHGMKKGY